MIIDLQDRQSSEPLTADLCIVGAGAAGIMLAREFIGTSIQVLVLESGGIEPDPEGQKLSQVASVGYPYVDPAGKKDFSEITGRAVGGSSHFWFAPLDGGKDGVRLRSLDPIDFEKREAIRHSGWPFSKRELDPYYRRSHEIAQIGSYDREGSAWGQPPRFPTMPLKRSSAIEHSVYQVSPARLFREDFPQELKEASNIQLVSRAHVLELLTSESGRKVEKVRLVSTRDGQEVTAHAKEFVLAAGGLQTPRLLLLSNSNHPKGIGNQHDLVGRFFMEHPHMFTGWYVPRDPEAFSRFAFYKRHRAADSTPILGYLTLTEETVRERGLPNYGVEFIPSTVYWRRYFSTGMPALNAIHRDLTSGRMPQQFGQKLLTIMTDLPNVASVVVDKVKRELGGATKTVSTNGEEAPAHVINYRLSQMSEQIPNPESRVRLSSERDPFGQPALELDWQLTRQDIEGVWAAQELLDQEFRRAGLGRVYRESYDREIPRGIKGGHHHMGTTRMHQDPKQGVVDANGRVHGVANLHIAGSSVFPTSGYANPTLTILALTLRLADHLGPRLK